ncbi:MAG: hypothetical protein ACO1OT_16140 [Heyndrickxia sp.]
MPEEKRYVLYEYLLFFWRKKWLLISIPIIITILVATVSLMIGRGYEGKVTFYTAELKKGENTDPDVIQSDYKLKDSKQALDVKVVNGKRVQFTITGDNKDSIRQSLNQISTDFQKQLMNEYDVSKSLTENNIKTYQEELKKYEGTFDNINQYINEDKLSQDQLLMQYDSTSKSADFVGDFASKIKSMKNDLAFYEKPKELGSQINKQNGNVLPNSIIGFVFSFFIMVLVLMLWKYIEEARKARKYND